MANKRNRILSNILDLPWQDDPTEARRIYMQIYRAQNPEEKIREILEAQKSKRGTAFLYVVFLLLPLYFSFALPNLFLIGL